MDENSSGEVYNYSQAIDYKQITKPLEEQNAHETHKPTQAIPGRNGRQYFDAEAGIRAESLLLERTGSFQGICDVIRIGL